MFGSKVWASTVGAATATVTASPVNQVFNEHTLVIAVFGAMGGLCRWFFLRESLREGARLAALGTLLAVGLGNLSALFAKMYFHDTPDSIWAQPLTAYNLAFFVGLTSVTLLGWLFDRGRKLGG